MASPSRLVPSLFWTAGSLFIRFVRPATAGPAPINRCFGFSLIPPSSGATFTGAGRITILSPGREAFCIAASVRNGLRRDPLPFDRAAALTYQVFGFGLCGAAAAHEAGTKRSARTATAATTQNSGTARGACDRLLTLSPPVKPTVGAADPTKTPEVGRYREKDFVARIHLR
jgi:hypothetical protein